MAKEKRKTIWVVSRGEYSDCHNEAAFTTKRLAENYARVCREVEGVQEYGSNRINDPGELTLNPGRPPGLKKGYHVYYLQMDRDGNTIYGPKIATIEWQPSYELYTVRWAGHPAWIVKLIAKVYARDELHAVKVANEKRAQYIASGEWDEKIEKMEQEKIIWDQFQKAAEVKKK